MKITFIGAAHEVTGSCTLIECGGGKGLVEVLRGAYDGYLGKGIPFSASAEEEAQEEEEQSGKEASE